MPKPNQFRIAGRDPKKAPVVAAKKKPDPPMNIVRKPIRLPPMEKIKE